MESTPVESSAVDRTILRTRTHFKVLFLPILLQIGFILIHLFIWKTLPHIGPANEGFDFWFRLVLHGIILVCELIYSIGPILRWLTDSFELTEKQVKTESGIIARKSQEIHLSRISQVEVDRGIIDRIFGAGTIRLYDASNTLGLEFKDVPRVKSVKQAIDAQRGL